VTKQHQVRKSKKTVEKWKQLTDGTLTTITRHVTDHHGDDGGRGSDGWGISYPCHDDDHDCALSQLGYCFRARRMCACRHDGTYPHCKKSDWDTGCHNHADCDTQQGFCLIHDGKSKGICVCRGGETNYPACSRHKGTRCAEDCSSRHGFCLNKERQCACVNGGMWPHTCCPLPCAQGESCYKGKCVCKYAPREDGNGCTLCRTPCGPLAECDEQGRYAKCQCKFEGNFPHCEKGVGRRQTLDCEESCGPGSECVEGAGGTGIQCTSCASDRVLVDGKCLVRGYWGRWGRCSVTCGSGIQERSQRCPRNVVKCYKRKSRRQACHRKNCPSRFEQWGDWSQCSTTCGEGTQSKTRKCLDPAQEDCNTDISTAACHLRPCKTETGDWAQWSHCSVTCGAHGARTRKRHCLTDAVGLPCPPESLQQTEVCTPALKTCSARMGEWGSWGSCSTSCGPGQQIRQRACLSAGEIPCSPASLIDTRNCIDPPTCGVSCGWCPWVKEDVITWDQSCGVRHVTETRAANCPAQKPPGAACAGEATRQTTIGKAGPGTTATRWKWDWHSPNWRKNWFKLDCIGGCIKVVMVRYEWGGKTITNQDCVKAMCQGKETCQFTPGRTANKEVQLLCAQEVVTHFT